MRIAIPTENGKIFSPFTEAKSFTLYNLEGGRVVSSVSIPTFGGGSAGMKELLHSARADVVICGGITGEAQKALGEASIAVYPGLGGAADDAAAAFAAGALQRGHNHDCAACAEAGGCPHIHGEDGCPHCG